MPLNEHEQRILEEIERQFYEEDPKLAQTVSGASLGSVTKRRHRIAVVVFVVGLIVMLGSFTTSAVIAVVGFMVMLAAAGWLTMNVRRTRAEGAPPFSLGSWMDRLRQRWGRDG